jgi:hypothetical protein
MVLCWINPFQIQLFDIVYGTSQRSALAHTTQNPTSAGFFIYASADAER